MLPNLSLAHPYSIQALWVPSRSSTLLVLLKKWLPAQRADSSRRQLAAPIVSALHEELQN